MDDDMVGPEGTKLSTEIGQALNIIEGNGIHTGTTPINASDETRELLKRWYLKAMALESLLNAYETLPGVKRRPVYD